MRHRTVRPSSILLVSWILLATLVPRQSALRPVYLASTYLLLPGLLGVVLVGRMLRSKGSGVGRPDPSDAALLLFLGWAAVSIALQDQPPAAALHGLINLWRTFAVPIAAYWTVRLIRPAETELAAWGPPLAALTVIEVGVSLVAWRSPDLVPSFWPGLVAETGGPRFTGTLSQPDLYAAVLVFCAAFLMASGPDDGPRVRSLIFGGGVAFAFSGVFLSFSRASWLGGLLALGVLGIAYRRRLAVPCVAIALSVTVLSVVPVGRPKWAAPSPTAAAPAPEAGTYAVDRLKTTRSITDRIVLVAAGVRMFLEKPLLGWGFGTYDRHARGFVASVGPFVPTSWARYEAASHCTHLSILAEMGLLGYGLLAFPAARLAFRAYSDRRRLRTDGRLVGLWAIAAFLAFVSVLVDLRYVATSLVLVGLVLGLIEVRLEADERDG